MAGARKTADETKRVSVGEMRLLKRYRGAFRIGDALIDAQSGAFACARHFNRPFDGQIPRMKKVEIWNIACKELFVRKAGEVIARGELGNRKRRISGRPQG